MNYMIETLLGEFENWKLEAKLEDSERYFYEVAEVDAIKRGNKSYVIGRKGTGKTALGERFLTHRGAFPYLSAKVSFKNFPFNRLYSNKDKIFTRPNQFITIWKYIIYMSVCRLMRDNQRINYDARTYLQKLVPGDDTHNIARLIPRWVAKDFEIKIFGTGGKISNDKSVDTDAEDWSTKVEILERFILSEGDESSYFVLFDELDEDYKDVIDKYQSDEYIDLITSLFKAVQDVRSVFRSSRSKVLPVVFLRDDIYELLQDSDKNKWNDLKVELSWDEKKIQNLLAFRISRAIDPKGTIRSFGEAWSSAFDPGGVPFGHRQQSRMPVFQYIARSTLLRPRDFVRYIQVAAEEQLKNKPPRRISPDTVRVVDKAFSNYLRSEFVDEIHAILPDINEVLQILSQTRKQQLSRDEFIRVFNQKASEGKLKTTDPDFVLRILFHFSVIGNVGNKVSFYRYLNKEATFNFREPISVHRGLFKSLQII